MMLELLGPDEASVGQFAAAHSATLLLSAVYLAIVTVVAPIVSVAARSASRSGLQDLMSSVVTIVAAFAVPFCVLTVLFRHQVMALFGPGYEAATGVLVILTIGQGLSVLHSPSTVSLEYTGWAKAAMWSTAAAAGTNIVLDVILIPFYGIIGAAVATFLVLIGVALAWAVQLYRAEGLITRPRLVLPRLSG
jgi:O-antigen/teichoic acid export membrane protein